MSKGKFWTAADQRRGGTGGVLTDPQDLPEQQEGSGKRGERRVEPAGLLACPAARDLEQGVLWPLTKKVIAVITARKMRIWGGAPSEGPEPELGSGSVIPIGKNLG